MKHLNNKKGFTLVEMMVAISILAVMVVMATVSWMLSLNHLSLRNDARDIASALKKAKQLAITTMKDHQVYFDSTNEVFQIEDCGAACGSAPSSYFPGTGNTHGTLLVGSLTDLRITTFGHKSINISAIATATVGTGNCCAWIKFAPNGTTTFSSGGTSMTITLARTDGNAETKRVEVNSMGRVAVP